MKSFRFNAKVLLLFFAITIAASFVSEKCVKAAGTGGNDPTSCGTAEIVISNITIGAAGALADVIENEEGIESVVFTGSKDKLAHYILTFAYASDDERAMKALNGVQELLFDYDIYVSTGMGDMGTSDDSRSLAAMIVLGVITLFAFLPRLGTVLYGMLDGIVHMGIIPGSMLFDGNISCIRTVIYMMISALSIALVMIARYRKMSRSP